MYIYIYNVYIYTNIIIYIHIKYTNDSLALPKSMLATSPYNTHVPNPDSPSGN